MTIEKCPICNFERKICFTATILNKHEVDYLFCENCGFLQTEEPYWLDEAYCSAIADTDVGLVNRNLILSQKLACLLYFIFDKNEKYLDIAGGYGLLTRLMRDLGFDFYWSDLYCQNLFAKGFELKQTNKPFSAITAFEVLEHVYNPVDFIKQSLRKAETSTMIFSTELFSGIPPDPNDWWYYAHETGQHISFYQNRTLKVIASKLALNYYSYSGVHIFTDQRINPILTRLSVNRFSDLLCFYIKKRLQSKIYQDYKTIKRRSVG